MRRLVYLLGLLVCLPGFVQASSTSNLGSIVCSGNQTLSFGDIASLTCSGDFSLYDGDIFSDSRISISAEGSLNLNNVSLTAPNIDLTSNSINLDVNSIINSTESLSINNNPGISTETVVYTGQITIGSVARQSDFTIETFPIFVIDEPLVEFIQIDGIEDPLVVQAVPLPASFWLMISGLMFLRKKLSEK
ncbi:MAG: hypothetical protein CTY18_03695 [Methylomonas sp.]|nr:MAG: hypothetical protein CTY24_09775 [Methylobacter sp.]PPD36896.1 MAG: hypothetical protein CTY18_03695 [Methylomonas sp.]